MTSVTQDAIPSTNEISTDSEDGSVQHIEDITHATTAPGTVTVTGSPSNTTTQQTISNTPHRHPVLNTTSLPHPFRPSDRARLLAHEAAACRRPMVVRLQDIHSVALLLDPQVQRPCLRSRDSGYDADESSNVSEDGNESDSSEEVHRVGEREREREREREQGGSQAAAAAAGGMQMVDLHEGTAHADVASSSATVE